MSFWDKIRFGSALRNIGKALKWAHETAIDTSAHVNPLLRIYYDSKLGSPVEKTVEEAMSASIYSSLKKVCPNWKWAQNQCENLGAFIAHTAVKALDSSKLIYHIGKGWISTEQAYDEIAKRSVAGVFALGKAVCKFGPYIKKISDYLPDSITEFKGVKIAVDFIGRLSLGKLSQKIFSEKNRERMERFTSHGLRVAHTAVRNIIRTVDTAIDRTQDAIKRGAEFISDVATSIKEQVRPFVEKVKEGARNIGRCAVNVAKKAWSWLTGKK